LTPDPQNARQHDDKNLKAIMGSLKEFGQRKPIVITEAGVIVACNGTVEAAKRLGWLDIQVVRVPADWTANQIQAFALADNRTAELASWNPEVMTSQLIDLQEAGFKIEEFGFEIQDPIIDLKLIEEDELPNDVVTRTALGEVWKLGNHRLVCGDSLKSKTLEILMDGEQAEMLHTDPPYGVDYEGVTNDHLKAKAFGDFIQKALTNAFEYLKPGSNAYVWHADIHSYEVIGAFRSAGFTQAKPGTIQWIKDSLVLSQGDYHSKNEPCLYGWKEGPGRQRVEDRSQTTVWNFDRPKRNDGHPTMKPIALCAQAILNSSKPQFLVLDLFAGSGSTLIACEETNRKARCVELDPKYCDVTIQRWENLTGLKAELLPTKAD
jgi:site-specific DNA-methyltransferase (adenine-specific)